MKEHLNNILTKVKSILSKKQIFIIFFTILFYTVFYFNSVPLIKPEAYLSDIFFISLLYYINLFLPVKYQKVFTYIISITLIIFIFIDISYSNYFSGFASIDDIGLLNEILGEGSELFNTPITLILLLLLIIGLSILFFITKDTSKYITIYSMNKINIISISILIILLNLLVPTSSYLVRASEYDDEFMYLTSQSYLYDTRNDSINYARNFGYFHYRTRDLFTSKKSYSLDSEEIINLVLKDKEFISNDYTNKYKDYNVINIIAESVDFNMINETLTPNTYNLLNNSIVYDNYFNTTVSNGHTCSSEMMSITSLYPVTGNDWKDSVCQYFSKNTFTRTLPKQLSNNGYNTYYIHNARSSYYDRGNLMKSLGYNTTIFGGDKLFPEYNYHRDEQLIELIEEIDFNSKFYTQMLTFASHQGFDEHFVDEYNYLRNNNLLTNNAAVNNFNAKLISFDTFIGRLIQLLKDKGVYDNTLISIYPDHPPVEYSVSDYHNLPSSHYKFKQKLIIHDGGKTIKHEDYVGHHVDIAPTLLNMLIGDNADYKYFVGTDMNNDDAFLLFTDNYVYYNNQFYKEEELINLPKDIQDAFVLSKKKQIVSKYILENNYS